MSELKKKPLFNPGGDTDIRLRRMIGDQPVPGYQGLSESD